MGKVVSVQCPFTTSGSSLRGALGDNVPMEIGLAGVQGFQPPS